ncbi:branched-chain amino acid ABC transporter permease [Anaerolentibacter hominis]|uniref:branched-chain amino acid ABC transporter permease n=1 Tax=Anaerolentibacter hominis TaxID=3079009 RepID=UPI0031B88B0F
MFLQQVINGLTIGSSYALVAVGYSMVFGVLRLTNFAHMSVFMLGGYIAAVALQGGLGLPLAVILSIAGCGIFGVLVDRCALMPMRKRGAARISYMICTIGISTFLQNLIMIVFGSEAIPFKEVFTRGQFTIGNAVVSYLQIFTMALTLLLMAGMSLLVYKTKMGSSMRAISQNEVAAKLMGVNTDRVITFTFFLGSALAAVAGIMFGMYYYSVDLQMGFTVGMKTFASAVLGGIGSLPGAVVGGFSIGVMEALFAGYVSSGFKDAVGFIVLIIVLIIKPSGLMGQKNVSKV